jgi:GTP cyclohydrolase II
MTTAIHIAPNSGVCSSQGARIVARAALPSTHGRFEVVAFDGLCDDGEHVAIVKGQVEGATDVPVRIHSECLTGDALGSLRCDCRQQLELALSTIGQREHGMVLYLRQEGRGIGLRNKLMSYELQDGGLDTVQANHALGFADDERTYQAAAEMLRCLDVASVELMTNNPDKIRQLRDHGVRVTGRIPHEIEPNPHNEAYLATKRHKSGHLLELVKE